MPQPLLDRLIDFAVATGEAADSLPQTPSGKNIAHQLARAGSSPAANYAEARHSLSGKEYVYKMRLCAKELRESSMWLTICHRRC